MVGDYNLAKSKDNFIGEKFGRLTVIESAGKNEYGHLIYRCLCDCGNETVVVGRSLKAGYTKSCGCYRKEVTSANKTIHGHRYERTYGIWKNMIARCENPNSTNYSRYGERGITVCDDWHNDYDTFYEWAMANGYSDDLSIDRINNDGNYSPENCRWTDIVTQANNTRRNHLVTYNGITHTLSEWSRLLDIPKETLRYRVNHDNMRDFEQYCEREGLG